MEPSVESVPGVSLPLDDGKEVEYRPAAQLKEISMTESEVTQNSAPIVARHRLSLSIGRDREENLKNIQFIEPEQGTPAALALAGKSIILSF